MARVHHIAKLGLGAAAVLAACAPALTAADCASVGGGELGADAPIDAKAGVIAWDDWSATTSGSVTRRNFLDCASGTGLQVAYQAPGMNVKPEVDALTFAVVDGARMAQFRDGLSRMGISFFDISYPNEVCGCRVFYPEERGGKTPYEAAI